MLPFTFEMKTRVIFGQNVHQQVGEHASALGRHAMIVTGRTAMRKLGVLDEIENLLKKAGLATTVYDRVDANPSTDVVDEGARVAKEEGVDVLVALGGGSPMDAAKGIAIVSTHGATIWDYVKKTPAAPPITDKVLPIVAIPTTSGTGSETTPISVISNKKIKAKDAFMNAHVFPRVSLVDPVLAATMPPSVTAATGMDAFSHVFEGFTSRMSQDLTDVLALEVMRRLVVYLPRAYAYGDDMEAREQVSWSAMTAGIVIAQTRAHLGHAMAHAVSGLFDNVPHGVACAVLTPVHARFNLPAIIDRLIKLAPIFGLDVTGLSRFEAAESVIEAVEDLLRILRIPRTFADYGITKNEIDALAKETIQLGPTKLSPRRPATEDELKELFSQVV